MDESRTISMNRLLLAAGVFFYLVFTFLIGGSVLWLTLWAYASAGESLSDTISAAVLNTTAATLLWLALFGGLDMFLTIWTIMQNRQMEVERAAREAERAAREETERAARAARAAREETERATRAQELADQRAFQQGIIEMLAAEREQSRLEREETRREREQFLSALQAERERGDLLLTRVLDLAERLGDRNGNGNGNGAKDQA